MSFSQKSVWVNGVFDLLHVGHIRLLCHAASMGELIVGINSDESCRALKGPARPIYNQEERVEMLSAISGVHRVFVYNEPDPVVAMLRWYGQRGPDTIVKGVDYEFRQFPERKEFPNAKFVFFDAKTNRRTSNVVKQIELTKEFEK